MVSSYHKTSTLRIDDSLSIPLSEFAFSYSRSSWPGGQNVNKVNSKVTLRWDIAGTNIIAEGVRRRFLEKHASRITKNGVFIVSSDRFRDQQRNIAACLEILRALLLVSLKPPKKRKPTAPSKGSKEKRLTKKKARSATKLKRGRVTGED